MKPAAALGIGGSGGTRAIIAASPVVLAPMAGVTNAPFRTLCRRFGPGLIYVNEMVMATALVNRNPKTRQMVSFGPDESPRSVQLYGSDPATIGEAVRLLCAESGVDHVDLNFGCPAAKVTRRGGGAAVPVKRRLLRAILQAAVAAATPYGVPVTAKFRMGIDDGLLTFLDTGRIAVDEGVAAIALHARTAAQHYSGSARWEAIGELKASVPEIPVLGNGDIWTAADAVEMIRRTGCDGVVVGRGCLGRPWLFADLVEALAGRQPPPPRVLGQVVPVLAEHARLLCDHLGDHLGIRHVRKHTSWYLTGYPVGPAVRCALSQVSSLAELDDHLATLDLSLPVVAGGERLTRGHTGGPIRVALPDGYLDQLDDVTPPDEELIAAMSGG